ncbi:MAG: hypothetical protein RL387_1773, partial [Bacteroidota bacterium]
MEKSILHRKAEHPSLIISLLLLAGILLGPYFVLSKLALTSLLLLSWGALVLMNVLIKNHLSKSLFSIICILFWGFCIVQFQQNTDDHSLLDKLEKYIQPIRDIILHKIDLYIKNNSNSQFVKALLVGEKNNIDPETLEVYTALGIVHIIAISGMHLDIIAQYLTKITGWLPKNKYLQLMELLFLTIAIITYSLVAHASPSIIRAALFFCLYTMGAYFNLHRYMLNIIASGLLIIILFDYQSITHIGWQLSYAAVLGIHFVHPIISNWLTLKNPIIQIIWNNFSITVSTQISTLPLLLYYFHTVSTGIILGNMVMIPLSNLLLEALIILLLLPAFWVKLFHWGEIIEIYMQKTSQLVHYIFTISPQPLYF